MDRRGQISKKQARMVTRAKNTYGRDYPLPYVTKIVLPKGSLLIKKVDSVTREPLSGVRFYVTDSSGAVIGNANGHFTTDSSGTVLIDGLTPGKSIVAKEVQAKDGYLLDDTPQTIVIRSGDTVTLEFQNQPKGSLLIEKRDAVTGNPMPRVVFSITKADGSPVENEGGMQSSNGQFTTDSNGQILLSGLNPGTYIVTEVRTVSGYVLDSTAHTVALREGAAETLTLTNRPKGILIVQKFDSVTKRPLPGA